MKKKSDNVFDRGEFVEISGVLLRKSGIDVVNRRDAETKLDIYMRDTEYVQSFHFKSGHDLMDAWECLKYLLSIEEYQESHEK